MEHKKEMRIGAIVLSLFMFACYSFQSKEDKKSIIGSWASCDQKFELYSELHFYGEIYAYHVETSGFDYSLQKYKMCSDSVMLFSYNYMRELSCSDRDDKEVNLARITMRNDSLISEINGEISIYHRLSTEPLLDPTVQLDTLVKRGYLIEFEEREKNRSCFE
jgi:GTP1/Obg family GTP-binding protein